jgi:hypothetical protein
MCDETRVPTTTAEARALYEASVTLGENRARYLERNGFGDGGYESSWVTLKKIGPIEIGFPNTASRKRAIRLHDLHHVLAQYGTDWTGEGEIGAFEIAAGCGDHWAAWFLNASAMSFGVFIAPRACFRAFVRGRHARTLYLRTSEHHGEFAAELLERNTGQMRERLGLDREVPEATLGDRLHFALWAIGTPLFFYGPLVGIALAIFAAL